MCGVIWSWRQQSDRRPPLKDCAVFLSLPQPSARPDIYELYGSLQPCKWAKGPFSVTRHFGFTPETCCNVLQRRALWSAYSVILFPGAWEMPEITSKVSGKQARAVDCKSIKTRGSKTSYGKNSSDVTIKVFVSQQHLYNTTDTSISWEVKLSGKELWRETGDAWPVRLASSFCWQNKPEWNWLSQVSCQSQMVPPGCILCSREVPPCFEAKDLPSIVLNLYVFRF